MIFKKPVLGLALGGGGARGFAHIGILKVLEMEGLHPDCLSGTSMGAIIAALYASGMSPEEIEGEARQMAKLGNMVKLMADDLNFFDYMLSAENVQNYLRQKFGECDLFSNVRLPLGLAAVDLISAREVVLQEGSLIKAVNASMALPGVAQPVDWDGMRLVDGGSLNNVPSDLVRSMGAQVVIAADVSPDVTDEHFWKEQKMPELATANWRSNAIMVANITAAKQRKARTDLIIRPELPAHITTLSGLKHINQIVAAGEQATQRALPAIRALLNKRLSLRGAKLGSAHPAEL